MSALKPYAIALVSFTATIVLVLLSVYVAKLNDSGVFLVGATGASVSLGLALIEQRLAGSERDVRAAVAAELRDKLDLSRDIDEIADEQLKAEVYSLAKALAAGNIPPHIAAIRIPQLYERAKHDVYASNVSLTADALYQWDDSPRYRSIVETSKRRGGGGPRRGSRRVSFSRTFVLRRSEVLLAEGRMEPRSLAVLTAQHNARIDVRIIWMEDLERDIIQPNRPLARNFTIFDGEEAVDTTDVQHMYRSPSEKLQELIDTQKEQLRYAESFERYLTTQ